MITGDHKTRQSLTINKDMARRLRNMFGPFPHKHNCDDLYRRLLYHAYTVSIGTASFGSTFVLQKACKMATSANLNHLFPPIRTRNAAIEAVLCEANPKPVTNKTGYFSLPLELRDKIMRYALIHGNIYIQPSSEQYQHSCNIFPPETESTGTYLQHSRRHCATKIDCITDVTKVKMKQIFAHIDVYTPSVFNAPKPKKPKIEQQLFVLGFQLLATNSRALSEGAPIFWSNNTFFFPPGPVCNTQAYFRNVMPEHSSLIRRLAIRLSPRDLTEGVLKTIEHHARFPLHWPGRPLENVSPVVWGQYCSHALERIWAKKLACTRQTDFSQIALETIRLEFVRGQALDFEFYNAEDFRRALHAIMWTEGGGEECFYAFNRRCDSNYPCVCIRIHRLQILCEQKVSAIVKEIGWTEFKKWMTGKTE